MVIPTGPRFASSEREVDTVDGSVLEPCVIILKRRTGSSGNGLSFIDKYDECVTYLSALSSTTLICTVYLLECFLFDISASFALDADVLPMMFSCRQIARRCASCVLFMCSLSVYSNVPAHFPCVTVSI